jgi:hypothetical protein
MIIGAVQLRFSDKKAKIDTAQEKIFMTPVTDNPLPVDWDNSREVDLKVSDLKNKPTEGVPYKDLPYAALKVKNYSLWEKDLTDWLPRTQKIQLFRSPYLDELSKAGETERDFRIRLQQISREKRDERVEKLREKYAKDFNRLDERIRKAQMTLEEQKAQATGQKAQVAVSIGETLLWSFLGRKSSTRVTRTSREIARTMKEKRDKENAESNLKALQQERAKLEEKFKSEVDAMEASFDAFSENLEKVLITPTRTNISIRIVALAWTMQ